MFDLPLAFAFSAGLLAVVNPCGFAMLPAYLGYFIGADDDGDDDTFHAVVRAVVVAATVAVGFVVVFGVIGFVIAQFSVQIQDRLPWVTMILGILFAALGVAMAAGFSPTVRLPKLDKGTGSRTIGSMLLFGMSYAIASLSCTLPVFSATITATLTRHSVVGMVVVFLTYALGMAVLLAGITVSVALARESFVQGLRRSMRHVQKAGGILLVVAGLFLAYYGWYELQVQTSGSPGGPGSFALDVQGRIQRLVNDIGPTRLGAVLVVAITATGFVLWVRSAGHRGAEPPSTPPASPE